MYNLIDFMIKSIYFQEIALGNKDVGIQLIKMNKNIFKKILWVEKIYKILHGIL